MTEFIFGVTAKNEMAKKQEWYVQGYIPKGVIMSVLAQAGVGKSTFADAVAMYIACEHKFLGKETKGCDVLIVDQESQRQGFYSRLGMLSNYLMDKKNKIFVEYCNGYYINHNKKDKNNDKSLIKLLDSYPSAKFILLDSWHAIAGDINPNHTAEVRDSMLELRNWLNKPENVEKTILITHHISEKSGNNAIDSMVTLNFSALAMGSSAFIQNLDCYFIISSPDKSKKLTRLYVRPHSKRVLFPNNEPFIVDIGQEEQEDNELCLRYGGAFQLPDPPIYDDIDSYFSGLSEGKTTATLKEMFDAMAQRNSIPDLRKAMRELEVLGRYGHYKGGQNNPYKYYAVEVESELESKISLHKKQKPNKVEKPENPKNQKSK